MTLGHFWHASTYLRYRDGCKLIWCQIRTMPSAIKHAALTATKVWNGHITQHGLQPLNNASSSAPGKSAIRWCLSYWWHSSVIYQTTTTALSWRRHRMETFSAFLAPFVRGIHRSRVCIPFTKASDAELWRFGMDKLFHRTFYWMCDYLSMLRFMLNDVSKRRPLSNIRKRKGGYQMIFLLSVIFPFL